MVRPSAGAAPESTSSKASPGPARPSPSPRPTKAGQASGYTRHRGGPGGPGRPTTRRTDRASRRSPSTGSWPTSNGPTPRPLPPDTSWSSTRPPWSAPANSLRLLDHAERPATKVVLVGDPRQLPEIHAGGAFAGLVHRLEATMLNDNRRQHRRLGTQTPWPIYAPATPTRPSTPTETTAEVHQATPPRSTSSDSSTTGSTPEPTGRRRCCSPAAEHRSASSTSGPETPSKPRRQIGPDELAQARRGSPSATP